MDLNKKLLFLMVFLISFSSFSIAEKEVYDWYDLDEVRNNVSRDIVLMNPLDNETNGYSTVVDGGFDSIGDSSNRFSGNFNGNSYSIRHFQGDGIFEYVENAEFKEIRFQDFEQETISNSGLLSVNAFDSKVDGFYAENISFKGASSSGIVFGEVSNCTIQNVLIDNSFIEGQNYLGLIAGYQSGLESSYIDILVNNSKIETNTSDSSQSSSGGILGRSDSNSNFREIEVKNSTIEGYKGVGGIIGNADDVYISDSEIRADLYGTEGVGSISGYGKQSYFVVNNVFSKSVFYEGSNDESFMASIQGYEDLSDTNSGFVDYNVSESVFVDNFSNSNHFDQHLSTIQGSGSENTDYLNLYYNDNLILSKHGGGLYHFIQNGIDNFLDSDYNINSSYYYNGYFSTSKPNMSGESYSDLQYPYGTGVYEGWDFNLVWKDGYNDKYSDLDNNTNYPLLYDVFIDEIGNGVSKKPVGIENDSAYFRSNITEWGDYDEVNVSFVLSNGSDYVIEDIEIGTIYKSDPVDLWSVKKFYAGLEPGKNYSIMPIFNWKEEIQYGSKLDFETPIQNNPEIALNPINEEDIGITTVETQGILDYFGKWTYTDVYIEYKESSSGVWNSELVFNDYSGSVRKIFNKTLSGLQNDTLYDVRYRFDFSETHFGTESFYTDSVSFKTNDLDENSISLINPADNEVFSYFENESGKNISFQFDVSSIENLDFELWISENGYDSLIESYSQGEFESKSYERIVELENGSYDWWVEGDVNSETRSFDIGKFSTDELNVSFNSFNPKDGSTVYLYGLEQLDDSSWELDLSVNLSSNQNGYVDFYFDNSFVGSESFVSGENKIVNKSIEVGEGFLDNFYSWKVVFESSLFNSSVESEENIISFSDEEIVEKNALGKILDSWVEYFSGMFSVSKDQGRGLFSVFISILIGSFIAWFTKDGGAVIFSITVSLIFFVFADYFHWSYSIILALIGAFILSFFSRNLLDWDG